MKPKWSHKSHLILMTVLTLKWQTETEPKPNNQKKKLFFHGISTAVNMVLYLY